MNTSITNAGVAYLKSSSSLERLDLHGTRIDDDALSQWKNKYNIPFPAGMVESDEEKTRFSWDVRSLPWLILTDSKHIVRAEGFGLTELDDKIRATN